MSRTLEISDELYSRLEAEARRKGLESVESYLEVSHLKDVVVDRGEAAARRVLELREQFSKKYGKMPDSTELIREDRER